MTSVSLGRRLAAALSWLCVGLASARTLAQSQNAKVEIDASFQVKFTLPSGNCRSRDRGIPNPYGPISMGELYATPLSGPVLCDGKPMSIDWATARLAKPTIESRSPAIAPDLAWSLLNDPLGARLWDALSAQGYTCKLEGSKDETCQIATDLEGRRAFQFVKPPSAGRLEVQFNRRPGTKLFIPIATCGFELDDRQVVVAG